MPFTRLLVVVVTAATLLLLAAVGASAAKGTFGPAKAVTSVVGLVSSDTNGRAPSFSNSDNGKHLDKETGQCHPPKKHHKHGTPGHKNHPCGDNDDDSD